MNKSFGRKFEDMTCQEWNIRDMYRGHELLVLHIYWRSMFLLSLLWPPVSPVPKPVVNLMEDPVCRLHRFEISQYCIYINK